MYLRNKTYYLEEYVKKERSPADIARELNTYPNRIRKDLKGYGIPLRDKSAAQSAAIKSGRHSHPTKGKERDPETKMKISASMARMWDSMDEAERERRVEIGKSQWGMMSETQKKSFKEKAAKAVRLASEEGSKLELYIFDGLSFAGYIPAFHVTYDEFSVDMMLDSVRAVIDIHGPTHFVPIWGEERLAKTQIEDERKMKYFIDNDFVFFRVVHMAKTISEVDKSVLLDMIIKRLKLIKESFPSHDERLIQLEVN